MLLVQTTTNSTKTKKTTTTSKEILLVFLLSLANEYCIFKLHLQCFFCLFKERNYVYRFEFGQNEKQASHLLRLHFIFLYIFFFLLLLFLLIRFCKYYTVFIETKINKLKENCFVYFQ